ncbi:hypothetical protein JCM11491_004969 [Sporobolomyces phaffii]
MTANGGKISPEVEFGTFLRLPHQSRTFSRPADSYIPSSPPSRPTSPPPTAAPSPSVFLHGKPAPVVSKMRQGAPRLGGLGLGGILEAPSPAPPPPLPARRQPLSASPKRASLPPAVPPAPAHSSSSRSASPASSLDARPQTPSIGATRQDAAEDGVIQRPFLSPEMDKPTVREGAFALDRPKVEPVLKSSAATAADNDEEDEGTRHEDNSLESEQREGAAGRNTQIATGLGEDQGAASPEAFPSPAFVEEENGDVFDRFKSVLVEDGDAGTNLSSKEATPTEDEKDSDRTSEDSAGESCFATPETVAASDDVDESIPDLALQHRAVGPAPEEEEIAFDGPTQLAAEEDLRPRQLQPEASDSQQATPHPPQPSTFESELAPAAPAALPSLSESLLARADKSTNSGEMEPSPAVSVATSSYDSREPSIHEFEPDQEAGEGEEAGEEEPAASLIRPHERSTALHGAASNEECISSPVYSQTSTLPEDLSPPYPQGVRHLDDPASQYPSPPSSPATSVQDSEHSQHEDDLPQPDDSSIYSIEQPTKISAHGSEFIEEVPHPPFESGLAHVDSALATVSPPEESQDRHSHESPALERSTTPPAPPIVLAPVFSPSAASPSPSPSPYFDRSAAPTGRRSRFSYQGLGLRMPSSIAPKTAVDRSGSDATSEPEAVPMPTPPSVRPASYRSGSTFTAEEPPTLIEKERAAESPAKPAQFPWIPSPKEEALTGYQDNNSYPSSPSAYAPSSVASSPEITQAYRVPISSPSVAPVVSAFPVTSTIVEALPPLPAVPSTASGPTSRADVSSDVPAPEAPEKVDGKLSPLEVAPTAPNAVEPEAREGDQVGEDATDPNQLSTVGVAVDIGTAVAGALVMGGLAVGQSAWRGLAVGWSAWRGASNQTVIQETQVLEVSNVDTKGEAEEEEKAFKSYARSKDVTEDSEGSKKAESSVLSTEWGEAEFEAPEGFLEEFKRAMAEIGEEDLAANEQAQVDAQLAAYQAASRQHVDAVSSPTMSDSSSLASTRSSSSLTFPSARGPRPRESSAFRSQPETIQEDSADEDERELEDLMAPVWDSPSRASRIASDFPTRHGFAPPPGLTGSPSIGGRPISVISTSSVGSAPGSPTPKAPASPRQPVKLSKTSKGILGFGRSKSTKSVVAPGPKPTSRIVPSPSLPGLAKPPSSVLSKESSTVNDETASQSSSHKTAGRRSSIFNFGGGGAKDAPPVPTIESQIKDTTYISYGRAKPERRVSNASIPAGLYASRDPYLIAPDPSATLPLSSSSPPPPSARRTREGTPSSVTSWSTAGEDVGGAPLGRRKSSLRASSAYEGSDPGGAPLARSTSIIVEGGKKLYRVRFGNAVGGIGLRSVADSEAERAGGDRYGQRWVGVGRGRYGNMVIKTDEESDMVYAEQVAQIKKKWRAFGSEQSRDWAAVRIDK